MRMLLATLAVIVLLVSGDSLLLSVVGPTKPAATFVLLGLINLVILTMWFITWNEAKGEIGDLGRLKTRAKTVQEYTDSLPFFRASAFWRFILRKEVIAQYRRHLSGEWFEAADRIEEQQGTGPAILFLEEGLGSGEAPP